MVFTACTTCRLAVKKEACRRLVTAAVKALPQAKRKLLQRAYKAECQAAAKRERREERSSGERPQCWRDLPADLLSRIMDLLDPFVLASAGLVCRAWQREMLNDDRWRRFCLLCDFGPQALRWHDSWRRFVLGDHPKHTHPNLPYHCLLAGMHVCTSTDLKSSAGDRSAISGVLNRWSSNRVMEAGRLAWVDPSAVTKYKLYHPEVHRVRSSCPVAHGCAMHATCAVRS